MFTVVGGAAGLNSASLSELPGMVDPPEKAHWDEVRDAHGAALQPSGPDTTWLATTPPPAKANDEAVLPWGSPADGFTAAIPRGGTETCRWAVGTGP